MPSCSPLVMSMKIINNQPIIRIDVLPGGTVVKNPPFKAADARDMGLILVSGRFPWRRKWQPTPVFSLEKSHGQRCLVGYSPWGLKESDTTEGLSTHTTAIEVLFEPN